MKISITQEHLIQISQVVIHSSTVNRNIWCSRIAESFGDVPAVYLNDANVIFKECQFEETKYGISGNGTAYLLNSDIDGSSSVARSFL